MRDIRSFASCFAFSKGRRRRQIGRRHQEIDIRVIRIKGEVVKWLRCNADEWSCGRAGNSYTYLGRFLEIRIFEVLCDFVGVKVPTSVKQEVPPSLLLRLIVRCEVCHRNIRTCVVVAFRCPPPILSPYVLRINLDGSSRHFLPCRKIR